MRRHEGQTEQESGYDAGMVKIARFPPQLYHVAERERTHVRFRGERPHTPVLRQKIIKKLHTRPGRRAFVRALVKPAGNGREIHDAAAGKQALRHKIRAVSADPGKIVIGGVAAERPKFRITHRRVCVIKCGLHTAFYSGTGQKRAYRKRSQKLIIKYGNIPWLRLTFHVVVGSGSILNRIIYFMKCRNMMYKY